MVQARVLKLSKKAEAIFSRHFSKNIFKVFTISIFCVEVNRLISETKRPVMLYANVVNYFLSSNPEG